MREWVGGRVQVCEVGKVGECGSKQNKRELGSVRVREWKSARVQVRGRVREWERRRGASGCEGEWDSGRVGGQHLGKVG